MRTNSDNHDKLDNATSARLAQLGLREVDTSALEAKIAAALEHSADHADDVRSAAVADMQIAPHRPTSDEPVFKFRSALLRAASLAAIIAITAMVIFFPVDNSQQAVASTFDLTTLHHELVDGRLSGAHVLSIDEANAKFAAQRADASKLPGNLANARVQSCCLADVKGRLTSIAVLEHQGSEVTLVVADAPRFAHRMGEVIEIDGSEYFGHAVGDVQMMMANRGHRWLCVMGDLDPAQLAEIASKIEF